VCLFLQAVTLRRTASSRPAPIAYHETEHYQITKAFLEHPDRMLRELLRDDGAPADEAY
jgi:predicted ATPase